MKLYVTTIIRNNQNSGQIYKVDYETGNIEKKKIMEPTLAYLEGRQAYSVRSDNIEGGPPGLRGISIFDGKVYCANSDSIFCYDEDLNLLKDKTIRNKDIDLCGIHEIAVENEDSIWVASSVNDRILNINSKGKILVEYDFEGRELLNKLKKMHILLRYRINKIMRQADRKPKDRKFYFRMYTLTKHNEKIYVFLRALELLLQIEPEMKIIWFVKNIKNTLQRRIPWLNPMNMECGRNLEFIDNKSIAMVNTGTKCIEKFDLENLKHDKSMDIFSIGGQYEQSLTKNHFATPNYFRGLKYLEEQNSLLIGSSPAKIIELDLESNRVVREIKLAKSATQLVFGIEALR